MELDRFGTTGDLQQLLSIRDRIDDLASRRLPSDGLGARAELRDHGDTFRLTVEVPGVTQEDLEIAVQGQELVIAGNREPETGEGAGELVFSERPHGPFHRTLTLPEPVDPEHATARLAAGLLILLLPKA